MVIEKQYILIIISIEHKDRHILIPQVTNESILQIKMVI